MPGGEPEGVSLTEGLWPVNAFILKARAAYLMVYHVCEWPKFCVVETESLSFEYECIIYKNVPISIRRSNMAL